MADSISVVVTPSSDSVSITIPSSTSPAITVKDLSPLNVSVSPNVAYQGLTNLIDVQGTPSDNQMIIYDEDQEAFVFIDLSSGVGGGSGNIVSDITVTNTDGGFDHIVNKTYSVADNVSLETIITNILAPAAENNATLGNLSPTSYGTYEVGSTPRQVYSVSFSVTSVDALAGGVTIRINGSDAGFDEITPTSTSSTSYDIQDDGINYTYDAASSTYTDRVFDLEYTDALSLNNAVRNSNDIAIKIRVRHLFYGSTTELAQGAIQSDIQNLYDAIVAASSSLASEQLVDRADDYTYSNTSDKYNLEVDGTYAYYFYEASLGELTDIKLGGSQGLEIDDAFIHITNGGAVSLSNGEVSTDYHVYRSRNKKAFTSGQAIYFKN